MIDMSRRLCYPAALINEVAVLAFAIPFMFFHSWVFMWVVEHLFVGHVLTLQTTVQQDTKLQRASCFKGPSTFATCSFYARRWTERQHVLTQFSCKTS